jgi:ribosome-binding protein aMBF1 (putative translation factor)
MIKNERQYRITKAQATKFEHALAQRDAGPPVHPLLRKAQEDALRSQLADLRAELEAYEALQARQPAVLELASFEDLPRVLIQGRITAGISQKELAERLGLKEQQIQRYEATDYASASLKRVNEVIRALGLKVRDAIILPAAQLSRALFFKRLQSVGLDRDLILHRLLPRRLAAHLEAADDTEEDGAETLLLQAAAVVGRVFGWTPEAIFASTPLQVSTAAVGAPRFKVAKRTDAQRLSAYTVYAHYLALLMLEATADLPRRPISTDALEIRQAILSTYGTLTFEHALRYVWSCGVPVLPLQDSGAFHGACWRVDQRNLIVLKQRTRSWARWLVDLLHELWHAGQDPAQDQFAVIEGDETTKGWWESPEEQAATLFAGDVVLAGRAEELAEICVQAAQNSVERLKAVVPRVAAREHVPADALANYMAFRLSLQGINWWGAATNLQEAGTDPWQTARNLFLEQANIERLNDVDRTLLLQALSDVEG